MSNDINDACLYLNNTSKCAKNYMSTKHSMNWAWKEKNTFTGTCCFKQHTFHDKKTGLLQPIFQDFSIVFPDQDLFHDFPSLENLSYKFNGFPAIISNPDVDERWLITLISLHYSNTINTKTA